MFEKILLQCNIVHLRPKSLVSNFSAFWIGISQNAPTLYWFGAGVFFVTISDFRAIGRQKFLVLPLKKEGVDSKLDCRLYALGPGIPLCQFRETLRV